MDTTTASTQRAGFACQACGKRYVWKPEYAGRKLKCTCGAMMSPGGESAAAAAKAVTVGSGYVVGHRAKPQVAGGEAEGSAVRDWVAPIVLLGVGVVGRFVEVGVLRHATGGPGVGVTAAFAVGGIVLATVALVLGVLLAAQVMGSDLDGPGALARKLGALAAFASAVAVLCASIDKDPEQMRGALFAVHMVLLIYFVGLCFLLKMDLLEGLMATVIAIGIQLGLFVAVAQALPASIGRLLFLSN